METQLSDPFCFDVATVLRCSHGITRKYFSEVCRGSREVDFKLSCKCDVICSGWWWPLNK